MSTESDTIKVSLVSVEVLSASRESNVPTMAVVRYTGVLPAPAGFPGMDASIDITVRVPYQGADEAVMRDARKQLGKLFAMLPRAT